MKFIEFDAEGNVVARYDSAVHGDGVPKGAVEVSDEVFTRSIAERDGVWRKVSGEVVKQALPPASLEVIRAEKWAAVKRERDRRCAEGGFKVAGKWFHSDSQSRIQQLGLVLLGAGIPAATMWKTMDGTFIEMTSSLAQQILAAAAASDRAIFASAETHRTAIYASADPASYDITAGWPLAFVG